MNSRHESVTTEVIEEIKIHVQNIALGLVVINSRVDT